jgi:hypothetical protein
MMAIEKLKVLDVEGSILFLGSGFSRGAENIRGTNLPTGRELQEILANELGIASDEYDLRNLADEFASQPHLNLYQTLYELFTVTKLQGLQKSILGLPWRRIYTTNYDDAVEFAYQHSNNPSPSFSYNDQKPMKLRNGSVIHLHGVIRSTTEENVLSQLVLNENAYIRQHFEKSLWYDEFERDLRFCSACFFLGYSLGDYHISALLMQNETLCQKTYFVTRETYDRIFSHRVNRYGIILPIGIEGFAELCRTLPRPERLANPHSLKAFKYLDPFKDKRALAAPTPLEILRLVTYGTFNYLRCLSTLPRAEYVVPRQKLADQAAKELATARCLVVHSRLGNGKSIFLHILAHKLSEAGYHCFMCRTNPLVSQNDLDLLQTFDKTAIFFDSYNTAIDLIEELTKLTPEPKFVVAVRSGVQEVRLHEIQQRLPKPLWRLSLNGIEEDDKNDFRLLLDRSGVRTPNLEAGIEQCNDFREVVVSLYDNREIKEKITNELEPISKDKNFRKVFIVSNLIKWVGQDVEAAFIRSVTGRDAYAEMTRFPEIAGDMFRLYDDELQVRSALFAEYLIQNHFTTADILECVYDIVVEAVKRKKERQYQAITSQLMQVSNLKRALRNDPHHQGALIGLFEKAQRDIEINKEPLFWLQYTILMIDDNNLAAAERFLETAYARAAASPGFRTYQIDTQALRLYLLLEERARDPHVLRFDQIIEKMELVLAMIGDESHRGHAIRVLEGIEPFIAARVSALAGGEMDGLDLQFSRLVDNLDRLSPEIRAQSGSDQVKASILRARQRIAARRLPSVAATSRLSI